MGGVEGGDGKIKAEEGGGSAGGEGKENKVRWLWKNGGEDEERVETMGGEGRGRQRAGGEGTGMEMMEEGIWGHKGNGGDLRGSGAIAITQFTREGKRIHKNNS